MKFALVNEQRREAEPSLKGLCPGCMQPVTAKCGSLRVWHWSHQGRRVCDQWWEPETEWHRRWKNLFPQDCQEVFHLAENGEKHIADVKTEHGLVIEFQHSAIQMSERLAREEFYKNMIWVVDCTRLKYDRPRIDYGLYDWRRLKNGDVQTHHFPDECFPKKWLDCTVPVLFDFDGLNTDNHSGQQNHLMCLLPNRYEGQALFFAVNRTTFLEIANGRAQIFDWRAVHAAMDQRYVALRRGRRSRY